MEIKIEIDTLESQERIMYYLKNFVTENYRKCKVYIDNKLMHEHDYTK